MTPVAAGLPYASNSCRQQHFAQICDADNALEPHSLGLPGDEAALAARHREEMAIVLRVDCEIALVRVVLRADLCQVAPRATLVVRPDDDIAEDVRGLSTVHVIVGVWRVPRCVVRRRDDGGGEAHGARRRFDK